MVEGKPIRRLSPVLLVALLVALPLGNATAGAPAPPSSGSPPPTPSPWEVNITPYGWLSAVTADLNADGKEVHASSSIDDVLRLLRFGGMGLVEVRYKRLLLLEDVYFARLEGDVTQGPFTVPLGPLTIQQGPVVLNVPRVNVPVGPIKADTTANTLYLDTKLGYRILSRSLSGPASSSRPVDQRWLNVDLLAGARYWRLTSHTDITIPPIQVPGFTIQASIPAFADLTLPRHPMFPYLIRRGIHVPSVTFGGGNRRVSETSQWGDLLVGARVRVDLPKRFSFIALGDVGGFGIGRSSKVTWQGFGLAGYRMSNHWTFLGGYRAMGIDHGGADVVLYGPVVGVSYRF